MLNYLPLILAIVIWCVTLGLCGLMSYAGGMSDNPGADPLPVHFVFWWGTAIAVLVGATHWLF